MATLGALAANNALGLSFAGRLIPGVAPGTGTVVGSGLGAMSLGVGLLVVGGLIDSKVMSGLFGKAKGAWKPPELLGLPVNNQGAGDPRIWAFGRRVRVPVHVLWQGPKVREDVASSSKAGMAPTALQRRVLIDCALAVNDRLTRRVVQLIGQGKLIFWTTRNIVTVRSGAIVVSESGGNLVLTMSSTLDPDFADKFEADDICTLVGFVPASGPNLNGGYWRTVSVTPHGITPSVLTLSPYSGQSLVGLNSSSGNASSPAEVLRVDDALVEHGWTTPILQAATNAPNYPGSHDPSYGIPPRFVLRGVATHPDPRSIFPQGTKVRPVGFTVNVVSGQPPITLGECVVRRVGVDTIELGCPGLEWWAESVTAGTSTNAAYLEFWDPSTASQGMFPVGFVPSAHFHQGTETQTEDSIIVAREGTGNVPGYRGVAYQALDRLNVTPFGDNLPPQLEVIEEVDLSLTWAQAFELVAERGGYPRHLIDTSGVDPEPCEGGFLRGAVSGATVLQPMLLAKQVATQERDNKLAFFAIDNADVVQVRNGVRYTDLIGELEFEDMAPEDLPTSVGIKHQDPDNYYAESYQPFGLRHPSAGLAENRQEVDLSNLVLTPKQARNLGATLMRRAHINSRQVRMHLPPNYLHVLENDLLTITDDEENDWTVRVIRRDVGSDYTVQVTGVVEEVDIAVSGSPVQRAAGRYQDPPTSLAPVVGRVLDVPPMRDQDSLTPGLLIAGAPQDGGAWAGCRVYRTVDGGSNWFPIGNLTYQAGVGVATSDLVAALPAETLGSTLLSIDAAATIDVEFEARGSIPLVSVTEQDVRNGYNWFVVRTPGGAVEVLAALTITQNSATSFTLSDLVRGLRGTAAAAALGQLAGAEVTAVSFLADNDGFWHNMAGLQAHRTMEFRFVPPGEDVSNVASVPVVATWRNCSPFPVRDVTKAINGTTSVRFSFDHWTRRAVPVASVGPYPLDEPYEEYRVDLWNASRTAIAYRRTVTTRGTGTVALRDKWVDFTAAEVNAAVAGYTLGPGETFWVDVVQVGDYGESPSNLQEL